MNITHFSPLKFIVPVILHLSLLAMLQAQNSKEATILYNLEPVKAEITPEGEVVRIIGPEPNYLKGFKLIAYDYTKEGSIQPKKEAWDAFRDINMSAAQGYEIKFEAGYATLNQNALKDLDEIVTQLNADPSRKILIADFEQYESDILSRNRVNSIRKYLKIKGIGEGRVSLNRLKGVYPENSVRIIFVQ